MTPRTIERLQYFVGKVCSIIVTEMNRDFGEKIAREHFVVRVREINVDGIWGLHPYNPSLVSYFALPHIISIHEETELHPENPEHAQMIQDYEERTGEKLKGDLIGERPKEAETPPASSDGVFIDIESLERLAQQTKHTIDAYDKSRKL